MENELFKQAPFRSIAIMLCGTAGSLIFVYQESQSIKQEPAYKCFTFRIYALILKEPRNEPRISLHREFSKKILFNVHYK